MLEILDVIIATAAVILGLSLVVQAIQQIIKQTLDLKSSYMRAELLALFGSPTKSSMIRSNIRSIGSLSKSPDEIPKTIVDQIEDKIRGFGFSDLHLLENIDTKKMKDLLDELPFAKDGAMQESFRKAIQDVDLWFDMTKSAFQEHYERRMKLWAFGISLSLVAAMNANIIGIYRDFSTNKILRESAVSWGTKLVANPPPKSSYARQDSALSIVSSDSAISTIDANIGVIKDVVNNNSFQLIRWDRATSEGWEKYFGWLIMALLVSLGAPFWYDLLKTIMSIKDNLKSTPKQQENSKSADQFKALDPAGSGDIPAVG